MFEKHNNDQTILYKIALLTTHVRRIKNTLLSLMVHVSFTKVITQKHLV